MKRNRDTTRAARHTARGKRSKYAAKVASGRQLYGPGCCAHTTKVVRSYNGVSEDFLQDVAS